MLQKRSLIINNLKRYISKQIVDTLNRLGLPLNKFSLSPPKQDDFGDLSTNVAMILSNGKIIAQDTPSNLVKNTNARDAYFGESFKFN